MRTGVHENQPYDKERDGALPKKLQKTLKNLCLGGALFNPTNASRRQVYTPPSPPQKNYHSTLADEPAFI